MIVTFPTMGTMASLDLADGQPPGGLVEIFERFDERFSLYRPDSELSLVAVGERGLPEASEQLRSVYAAALGWRSATGGAFTPHRPDGVIDLNGIVKALAMREAGLALSAQGIARWCLNVGGDVLSEGGVEPWTMGIVDPLDRASLLCAVHLREPRRSLATSGIAERGEHVWRSSAIGDLVQVSVLADDILTADVLATAILSGGAEFRDEATARWDIDVLTVDRAGELAASPGMRSALAVG